VHRVFYEPAGTDTFVATSATAGPWSPHSQHGGPPSALAARAIERHEPDEGQRLARVAIDILRPVPVAKITVRARTVRPGRRVALIEAVMEADGQEVLHARGWRIATGARAASTAPAPAPPAAAPSAPAPPAPVPAGLPAAERRPLPTFSGGHTAGYVSAVDWRFLSGGDFATRGPARVWMSPRVPLLEGEELTPMCRTLLVADSGSGVSAVLDPVKFLFVNVDLTVALTRDPVGEWLCLDSVSTIGDRGSGLAETVLSDVSGPCGRALQTLLVAPR
jgi:Thioesterase-like superfamily